MRQVLFIQGAGEGTHDEWDNLLVESLRVMLGPDFEIDYPRMPNESDPGYLPWKKAIVQRLSDLEDGAVLIGHSIGATILASVIAENPPPRRPMCLMLLAAPYIGDGGWPSDEITAQDRLGSGLPDGVPVYLYHGSGDEIVPHSHVYLYAKAIPQAIVRRLEGRDHQLHNDLREVAEDIRSVVSDVH